MWDITGKKLGVPIYQLLGGACRDKIRVYANGWSGGAKTPEAIAEKASQIIEMGFTALKFDPIPGPWRSFVSREVEEEAVENVAAVRQAVGPDVEILVEMHRRLAPMHAVRIARNIEQFRPFWYEEPVLAENVDALAAVKRDDEGDPAKAMSLLDESLTISTELGMRPLMERVLDQQEIL